MYATLAFLAELYPIIDGFSVVSDYGCLLTCIWQSSAVYCMEVTDGSNECDQAALGSPHLFICLQVVYVDAVKEKCPVLGLLPTRYADDLIS